ncbi:MAG: hypothetical protein ACN6OP_00350 [Pseudomonadales bacterium]
MTTAIQYIASRSAQEAPKMRIAAPMTFGARLARHRLAPGETAWFFNVPQEPPSDTTPPQAEPAKPEDKVQIGPLDV